MADEYDDTAEEEVGTDAANDSARTTSSGEASARGHISPLHAPTSESRSAAVTSGAAKAARAAAAKAGGSEPDDDAEEEDDDDDAEEKDDEEDEYVGR